MPLQKMREEFRIERGIGNLRRFAAYPLGSFFTVLKANAPELSRIAKGERACSLSQHEMIVPLRPKGRRLDAQRSAHSQVNAERVLP